MDGEFTINDFLNVIILKNQLITMDSGALKEIYQDYDSYLAFIDKVSVLTSIDSSFLFLREDFIDKIEEILSSNRFEADPVTWNVVNEAISYLNMAKFYSNRYKDTLKKNYLSYHANARKCKLNEELLLSMMVNDAFFLLALEEKNLDSFAEDDYFMSSLNYFIETVPELFQEQDIQEMVERRIESVTVGSWPFSRKNRTLLKETKNHYQKIKQKEE
mgnify:CR=1 FL=1